MIFCDLTSLSINEAVSASEAGEKRHKGRRQKEARGVHWLCHTCSSSSLTFHTTNSQPPFLLSERFIVFLPFSCRDGEVFTVSSNTWFYTHASSSTPWKNG